MKEEQIDIKSFEKLPKFIAVEGPIGAGKTTLSRLLANSFGYDTFLEKPSENPFLPDFYINPSQAALATQLFFLFQRVKQIQEIKQEDIFLPNRVSDFLLDKDRLFAKATLSRLLYIILIEVGIGAGTRNRYPRTPVESL